MNYQELIFGQHKGTTQQNRFTKALSPEYARIDGRSLEELLAFLSTYSKQVRFFNRKDEPFSNWYPFLIKDVSIILANIIAKDLSRIEKEHVRLVNSIQSTYDISKKIKGVDDLARHIFFLLKEIDNWYRQVSEINIEKEGIEGNIEEELRTMIEVKLREYLIKLIAYVKGAEQTMLSELDLVIKPTTFDKAWELENIGEIKSINIYEGNSDRDKIINARIQYQLLFQNIFNKYSFIVLKFKRYFEQSIENKSNHKPDIGLLISFLKIYNYSQIELNKLSSRLLEFYYFKILNQEQRAAIPDTVHVNFDIADHVQEHYIPKGTKLIAGRDRRGDEILYETKEDIDVNKAKIVSLKTLYLSHKYESTSSFDTVTNIYAAEVANSKDGQGTSFDKSNMDWALFGEEQYGGGAPTMSSTALGIGITSPIFFLKEGERKVKLTFTFAANSMELYELLLEDITQVQEGQDNVNREAFRRLFPRGDGERNLQILLSGTRTWIEAPSESIYVSPGEKNNQLTISFTIPTSASSVVAYNATNLNDKRYATRYPLMKLIINDKVAPYLYTFIKDLVIENIDIDVEVKNIKTVQLYNDIGLLDATQPVQAFGNQPTIGSYLLIGNSELFRKTLNSIKFNFQWLKIPNTANEFEEHYKAYGERFRASYYKVKLQALYDYEFSPTEDDYDDLEFHLFNDEEYTDAPLKKSEIQIGYNELNIMNIQPNPQLEQVNNYDNETKSGYFKLELAEPELMFGHELYPQQFAEVVTKNAKKDKNQLPDPIPKEPYTPILKELSLDYTASTSIDIKARDDRKTDKLFHIHPFGIAQIYPSNSRALPYLLPQYDKNAYLYIGLENVSPDAPLSLLFQLTASKSKGDTKYEPPAISWSYLVRNEWKPFKDIHHLSDTTDKFTKTGIIKLIMPNDISARNTILPTGIYWLRIAIDGDIEILCRAIDVRTQVVACQWMPTTDSTILQEPLPPLTINRFDVERNEIRTVSQPFESFGGLPKEDFRAFSSRISESLRHKGRAITKWDYERIILEKFHEIEQVKCLNFLDKYTEHFGDESQPRVFEEEKGVVMVVVPRRRKFLEDSKPRVNYRTLQRIEDYLATKISPFVKLRIRNPGYEYVRVVCNVKFDRRSDVGRMLQRLKRDINKYISPWLFQDNKTIAIGAIINQNAVQDFIRGLHYVKFLTKFSLIHVIQDDDGSYALNDTASVSDEKEVAKIQTRPWGVFIPDEHEITVISGEELEHEPPITRNRIPFKNIEILKERSRKIKINRRPHYSTTAKKNNKDTYQLKIVLPNGTRK